eukprot:CAMPEP_0171154322 /NCGR_PEP_ID=MMETSP0790-20130122/250_1 /TAXON_ID=2925 /ORGANISM="Alexandrium catenella, Strain OF101" /LENGTH=44 /DNA_ID= /DNA_START= /DNA_END= /DNA_ORIENTATION=
MAAGRSDTSRVSPPAFLRPMSNLDGQAPIHAVAGTHMLVPLSGG